MKKDNNIIIRVDSELKENAMRIIRKEGFSLSDVLNASLKDIVHRGMIPMYLRKFISPVRRGPGYIDISFIKKCLGESIQKIEKEKIKKIYLFGSFARGDEKFTSDIDLRIEPGPGLTLVDLGNIRQDLMEKLNRDVDLLAIESSKLDTDFYENIRKDEICLYDQQRYWNY